MPNNLVLPRGGSGGSSTRGARAGRGGGASTTTNNSSSSTPTLSLPRSSALGTLIFGKASRVFAAFVSFHFLQDSVALPLYLFFVTFGAAVFLLSLQRPWSGRRIGSRRLRKVIVAGGILAVTLYLWTAGLRSAGPLRTLLVDGAELPLLYLYAIASRREIPEKRKSRGALLMLLSYALLIWDASGSGPSVKDLERTRFGHRAEAAFQRVTHHGGQQQEFGEERLSGVTNEQLRQQRQQSQHSRKLQGMFGEQGHAKTRALLEVPSTERHGVRDAFVEGTPLRAEFGVLLVLAAAVLMQSSRTFTRRLATELGGAKRHFALSVSIATAWLSPLALASYISDATGSVLSLSVIGGVSTKTFSIGHAICVGMVGFFWLVVPYYVRAIVSTSLPQKLMLQCGVVVPFVMAIVGSFVFGDTYGKTGLSWILLLAFLLDWAGIALMTTPIWPKRGTTEIPLTSVQPGQTSTPVKERNAEVNAAEAVEKDATN